MLRQLAAGLSFLHASGKLHRDVKPSNVMVTGEGRVVIADFGLVGDVADLVSRDGICGTPAYMAPEKAARQPVGTAADWYSVGILIYEALTGRVPFQELLLPTGTGTFAMPGADAWPLSPPSAPVADVPEDLDRLCMDLLAYAHEQRPSGREVRRRLGPDRREADPAADEITRREERAAAGEAPFIGGRAQLAVLGDALAATERGRAVTVRLHGHSGMGKSALVQRLLGEIRAQAPERLVLSGRCFEQESVPYKGIDGLVDDLCGHLRSARGRGSRPRCRPTSPRLARMFCSFAGSRFGA